MYSIGIATNPREDDQRFEDREVAEPAAACDASIDDDVWAVWDDETGEVIALAFQSQLFWP
jgi:hypothetical protein